MPQLDQFTYLTQFVWLCIFYMTFYVLLYNDGLPKISRVFKLRAYLCTDRLSGTSQGSEFAASWTACSQKKRDKEASSFDSENQDVIFRTLNSSVSYLNSGVAGATSWCTNSVDSLNANQLKSMNKSYLRSIGEIGVSQLIKYNALEASAPITNEQRRVTSSVFLEISQVWSLRVQKCLLGSIKKKKKK